MAADFGACSAASRRLALRPSAHSRAELVDEAPDAIEQRLVNGKATVAAFSRRGNLLAAGRSDGSVVIWDFETRGVWCTLRREEGAPVSAIT
jgi:WD40 repeat protein